MPCCTRALALLILLGGCRGGFAERTVDADPATIDVTGDGASATIDAPPGGASDAPGDAMTILPPGWSVMSPKPASTVTLWGVQAFSTTDVWITGMMGEIEHYDGAWTTTTSGASGTLYEFAGTTNDLWLAGDTCVMLHRTTGAWGSGTIPSCTTAAIQAIDGVAPNDLWAAGLAGTVSHWNGTTWTTTTVGNIDYWQVLAVATNDVYLIGSKGTIEHWNGATWTAQPSGIAPSAVLTGIWGSGGEYWAVADNGKIIHKVGAGAWTTQASPTTQTLYDVNGTSASDVWAIGTSGTIVHYDGSTWSTATSPTTVALTHLARVPGGTTLYAVGDTGTVLIDP